MPYTKHLKKPFESFEKSMNGLKLLVGETTFRNMDIAVVLISRSTTKETQQQQALKLFSNFLLVLLSFVPKTRRKHWNFQKSRNHHGLKKLLPLGPAYPAYMLLLRPLIFPSMPSSSEITPLKQHML